MELRSGYACGFRSETQRPALTEEQKAQLAKGVRLVFGRWTCLNLAVQNQWGGPNSEQKRQELAQSVLDWLLNAKEVYADELEDLLDAEMMDSWNVQAEDGSPREVSVLINKVFYETVQGKGDTVQWLERTATAAQRQIEQSLREEDTHHHTSMGMQDEQQQQQQQQRQSRQREVPQVDEDGWTTVPNRRR